MALAWMFHLYAINLTLLMGLVSHASQIIPSRMGPVSTTIQYVASFSMFSTWRAETFLLIVNISTNNYKYAKSAFPGFTFVSTTVIQTIVPNWPTLISIHSHAKMFLLSVIVTTKYQEIVWLANSADIVLDQENACSWRLHLQVVKKDKSLDMGLAVTPLSTARTTTLSPGIASNVSMDGTLITLANVSSTRFNVKQIK